MKTEKSKTKSNHQVSAKALLAKVTATKKLAGAAREHLRLMKLEHKLARKAFKQAKKAAKIARKKAKAGAKLLNAQAKNNGTSPKAKGRIHTPSKGQKARSTTAKAARLLPDLDLQRKTPLAETPSLATG